MYKKAIVILIMSLIMLISIGGAYADTIEKKDIQIYPDDYVFETFYTYEIDKGDKIKVEINSNIPVNVYMMAEDDWNIPYGTNFTDAKYSEEGITSTSFTFTVPDDQIYHLVIYNSNNSTATVDYEYTDVLEDELEELGEAFGMAIGICIAVVIVVIVVIILIIYLIFRKKSPAPPPPGVYPPQQPGYQQPPPGQYPPPQQPPPR